MTSVALLKRLLGYSFNYWAGFLVAVIAMVITAATETAFPAMMKPLMDNGFRGNGNFQIWWVPAVVLLIFLLRGISSFVANYSMQWISNNVLRDIRQEMFEKLISLPSAAFDASSAGKLISRMMSEAQMVLLAATNVVTVLVRDTLVLVGLLGWLLWLNWKLTFVVIFLMPFLALMTWHFSRRMRGVSKNYLNAVGQMTATVEEAISGNRVIKIFDGKEYETERFRLTNSEYRGQAMRLAIASALQSPISQLIAAIGVAVVLTIALFQSRSGETTVGDFVSFITAMLMMFSPLKHLSDINSQLQRGLAAAENVFALIDQDSEKDNGQKVFGRVDGSIDIENVTLKYPSRTAPALTSICLKIPAGKTYAFVGPSGGGKSSIVNLIPRFYDVTSGVIKIDGVNINSVTLASLRKQIAFVSQDIVLFNDTIANNIAYGRKDISPEEIMSAANAAALLDFVQGLPQGISTVIGDRGVRISGGQRQRIAIARAIIKNAPILILDEATSALDTKAEESVQAAIERLRDGRTTLVVAHRLSTVLNADMIVVLDSGKIVQQGTHKELINQSGLYKSLYRKLSQDQSTISLG